MTIAQGKWKEAFYFRKAFKIAHIDTVNCDSEMNRYRREAALERKLAAAQRTIEAQAKRIEELEAQVQLIKGYISQYAPDETISVAEALESIEEAIKS